MHPNEALVRKGYEAFTTGDFDTTLSLMSDDIKWHVGGRHAVSGDYEGRDAVHGFFGELFKITAGSFRIDVHDVLASDDHAVVLGTMTGTRGHKKLHQRFVHVFHANGTVATEWWHLPLDPYHDDEFWAANDEGE